MSALPAIIFLVPFLAALLAGVTGSRPALARGVAVAALGTDAALAAAALVRTLSSGPLRMHMGGWGPPLGIEWSLDPLGAGMAALVAGVGLLAVLAMGEAADRELEGRRGSFYACALLLVSGLVGIAATADLFNLFVHLELASLSAYALVGAGGRGAPLAAIRYLIVGSLGATLYLLGVGHIYAATGTLHMGDAAARLADLADPRLATAGKALVVAGLAVKMGLFPLHRWMPPAYARAPIAAAALVAPLFTKVAAYALIRVLYWVFAAGRLEEVELLILEVLAWAGAAAIVGGGVLAAVETDLRRLLAYSSISQMGVVALGAGLATASSLTGAVLHLANDALMKATLFVAAGVLLHRFGAVEVRDLARARGRAPLTTAAVVVAGLSVIGVPPLCGFFGKWYVLVGALETGRPALAASVIAGGLLGLVYVFRLIEPLLLAGGETAAGAAAAGGGGGGAAGAGEEGPPGAVAIGLVLAALVVLLGIFNARVVSAFVARALPPGI